MTNIQLYVYIEHALTLPLSSKLSLCVTVAILEILAGVTLGRANSSSDLVTLFSEELPKLFICRGLFTTIVPTVENNAQQVHACMHVSNAVIAFDDTSNVFSPQVVINVIIQWALAMHIFFHVVDLHQ